jgi:hypothetical protein
MAPPGWTTAARLLTDVSDVELRNFGVLALRTWRVSIPLGVPLGADPVDPLTAPAFDQVQISQLARQLVPMLVARHSLRVDGPDLEATIAAFNTADAMTKEWARPFAELIWWLDRAGLAVPTQWHHQFPTTLRITARGLALLESNDWTNPLLPGYLDSIRVRCRELPDQAVALLVDARACLDHGLFRPSVVLIGVAYEFLIEEVFEVLATKGFVLSTGKLEAGERLRRIRGAIEAEKLKEIVPEREDRGGIRNAYDFAEQLRLRRNEAAHTRPTFDFDHGGETEEFIVSAGRHLPAIWLLWELARADYVQLIG